MDGARKGVRGNYFHETTLAKLFTIHVNLQAMEFAVKQISWKSQKSAKFTALEKRAPYGSMRRLLSMVPSINKAHCNFAVVIGLVCVSAQREDNSIYLGYKYKYSIAHIIQLHLTRVQTMLQLVRQITAAGAVSIFIASPGEAVQEAICNQRR